MKSVLIHVTLSPLNRSKPNSRFQMGPIKYDSIEISHPTLEYGEQCDGTMLSPCAFTRIYLFHNGSVAAFKYNLTEGQD